MTAIQPELWVDRGATAIEFYRAAFGAEVVHRVVGSVEPSLPSHDREVVTT